MGNVQCCASDRLLKGKTKKPKSKKKSKKKEKSSSKINGNAAGGKTEVPKSVESEKASARKTVEQSENNINKEEVKTEDSKMTQPSPVEVSNDESPRSESTASARERFFGQNRLRWFLEFIRQESVTHLFESARKVTEIMFSLLERLQAVSRNKCDSELA
ncbi:unnamed protein product [Pieris macdunnoughi]|uniref:Uncharacterized protein n=1 Tax=Pieris macdunnoughi TaxID=345717 RepID=A0A821X795_9NEOP|nr:unnamed protein product [Pieris macdunnoughi]